MFCRDCHTCLFVTLNQLLKNMYEVKDGLTTTNYIHRWMVGISLALMLVLVVETVGRMR